MVTNCSILFWAGFMSLSHRHLFIQTQTLLFIGRFHRDSLLELHYTSRRLLCALNLLYRYIRMRWAHVHLDKSLLSLLRASIPPYSLTLRDIDDRSARERENPPATAIRHTYRRRRFQSTQTRWRQSAVTWPRHYNGRTSRAVCRCEQTTILYALKWRCLRTPVCFTTLRRRCV